MSLTRKLLSAMGIAEEQAEQIINAHMETVTQLKQERDDLKEKAEKADGIQKDLDAANAKLKEFEDSNETDTWKDKYNTLKKEYDEYKDGISAKELLDKKKSAYRDLLKASGISEKRLDTVLKVTDLSAVELDDEGKIKDSATLEKSIKEEWADFIGTQEIVGANVPNPAGANGTGNAKSPEVNKPMSYAARRAAQYNREHYGAKED